MKAQFKYQLKHFVNICVCLRDVIWTHFPSKSKYNKLIYSTKKNINLFVSIHSFIHPFIFFLSFQIYSNWNRKTINKLGVDFNSLRKKKKNYFAPTQSKKEDKQTGSVVSTLYFFACVFFFFCYFSSSSSSFGVLYYIYVLNRHTNNLTLRTNFFYSYMCVYLFIGLANKSNANINLKNDTIIGQFGEFTISAATCKRGIHGGIVQEILHRKACQCS